MAAPVITNIDPSYAAVKSGAIVNITGTDLNGSPVVVTFNGVVSPLVNVIGPTSLDVTLPDALVPSFVNVVVSNSNGVSAPFVFSVLQTEAGVVSFGPVNPWFDPAANYTVYGVWDFVNPDSNPPSTVFSNITVLGNAFLNTVGADSVDIGNVLTTDITVRGLTLDVAVNDIDFSAFSTIEFHTPVTFDQLTTFSTMVSMPGLAVSVQPDVLYISAGGVISKGPAPGGGAGWSLLGNTGVGNVLGSTDVNSWTQIVNSVTYVSLSTTSYDVTAPEINVTAATGEITISALANKVNIFGNGKLNLGSTADGIEVSAFAQFFCRADGYDIDSQTGSVAPILIGSVEAKAMTLGNLACVTTMAFNGLSAAGTGNVLVATAAGTFDAGSQNAQTKIHGVGVWVKSEGGNAEVTAQVGGSININGDSGGGPGNIAAINLGTLLTDAINFGDSGCVVIGAADTFALDTASTLHLGAGAAMTIAGALSIDVAAPAITINTAAATNTTTIGNVLAGNNVVVNSASVVMPNLPNTAQTNYVAFNSGTGAFTYQSVASLSSNFWNTAGNNTGVGLKLGAGTGSGLQMTADNFAFMSVNTTIDVSFGVNTFGVDLLNDSQSITLSNPWNVGPEFILITCGGVPNDSFIVVKPLDIQLFSRASIELQAATTIDIDATTALSTSSATLSVTTTGNASVFCGADLLLQASTGGATLTLNSDLLLVNATTTATFQMAAVTYMTVNATRDVVVSSNTWSMDSVSTTHIGSGAAMDLGSGASIDISAPAVTINTAASTNTLTIGNVLAGNNLVINCASIQAPNTPTQTGTVAVPTHTPPAGFNYLAIDAAGNIIQFAA